MCHNSDHLCLNASLQLPEWLQDVVNSETLFPDVESQARLAVRLAHENVIRASGGPFGAAVFEQSSGKLISVGVNQVVSLNLSIAHAEVMALLMAQRKLGRARLNENGERYTLATSAQPCAMCFGAIPWAGIDTLIISARREDVESLTAFEEGPVPDNWQQALEMRQITVIRDIYRDQAIDTLKIYSGKAY